MSDVLSLSVLAAVIQFSLTVWADQDWKLEDKMPKFTQMCWRFAAIYLLAAGAQTWLIQHNGGTARGHNVIHLLYICQSLFSHRPHFKTYINVVILKIFMKSIPISLR